MKRTRRPIGSPPRVTTIDFNAVTIVAGMHKTPVPLGWLDAGALVRRSTWRSCAWCGDPRDGHPRCWRCNHQHGDSAAPTRWWEENRLDSTFWNDHRRAMVEAAFEDDERCRGYSCEA